MFTRMLTQHPHRPGRIVKEIFPVVKCHKISCRQWLLTKTCWSKSPLSLFERRDNVDLIKFVTKSHNNMVLLRKQATSGSDHTRPDAFYFFLKQIRFTAFYYYVNSQDGVSVHICLSNFALFNPASSLLHFQAQTKGSFLKRLFNFFL